MPEYKLSLSLPFLPNDINLASLKAQTRGDGIFQTVERTDWKTVVIVTKNILPGAADALVAMARGITGVETIEIEKLKK